jgi:hypothetical protein
VLPSFLLLPPKAKRSHYEILVHDFFTSQPIRDASVFLLRCVLHDWPSSYAKKILQRLHAVAQPDTKVVVVDHVLTYAIPSDKGAHEFDIPGENPPAPPPPLIPGAGNLAFRTDTLVRPLSS